MDIFTVGHSNYSLDYFLKILISNNINCIVDVRSIPYSSYNSQFNRECIKYFLNKNNLIYLYMGDLLGAKRVESYVYDYEKRVDFEKVEHSKIFKYGIERLGVGISKNYKIALMCAEKIPWSCHRSILIGKYLKENGYNVYHILNEYKKISQYKLEEILVEEYFPNKNQISFIDENNLSYKELIKKSYRLKNNEIGYKIDY